MSISEDKQQKLLGLLTELASENLEDDMCKEVCLKLEGIYSDNFRHRYSELFPLLVKLSTDGQSNVSTLSTSLETLNNYLRENKDDSDACIKIRDQLFKLTDHLSLEISRYEYYAKSDNRILDIEKNTETLRIEIQNLKQQLTDTSKKLTKAQDSLSSSQAQTVAVLGVFAAIVTTFAGGLSYLNGTLANLHNIPTTRALCIVSVCGFVVANTIYLLMKSIGSIVGKSLNDKRQRRKTDSSRLGKINTWLQSISTICWINIALIITFIVSFIHA